MLLIDPDVSIVVLCSLDYILLVRVRRIVCEAAEVSKGKPPQVTRNVTDASADNIKLWRVKVSEHDA